MRVRDARLVDPGQVDRYLRHANRPLPERSDPVHSPHGTAQNLRCAVIVDLSEARPAATLRIRSHGLGVEHLANARVTERGDCRIVVPLSVGFDRSGRVFLEIETDDGDLWVTDVAVGSTADVLAMELTTRTGFPFHAGALQCPQPGACRISLVAPHVWGTMPPLTPVPPYELWRERKTWDPLHHWASKLLGERYDAWILEGMAARSTTTVQPRDTQITTVTLLAQGACRVGTRVKAGPPECIREPEVALDWPGPLRWIAQDRERAEREVSPATRLSLSALGRFGVPLVELGEHHAVITTRLPAEIDLITRFVAAVRVAFQTIAQPLT